jgi:hypothetical protein
VVIRVINIIEADKGNFEQPAWVLKGESVTLIQQYNSINAQYFDLLSNLFTYFKNSLLLNRCELDPRVCAVFWLNNSSGIKFQNIDLNYCDTSIFTWARMYGYVAICLSQIEDRELKSMGNSVIHQYQRCHIQ